MNENHFLVGSNLDVPENIQPIPSKVTYLSFLFAFDLNEIDNIKPSKVLIYLLKYDLF